MHRQRVPYGGMYEVERPDLGLVGRGTNWEMILNNVYAWRKANSIPNGLGVEDQLEDLLCIMYPSECVSTDPEIPRKRELSMQDVVRGTQVLVKVVAHRILQIVGLSDGPFVDQLEANRRAEICSRCPYNITYRKPCTGLCPELVAVIKAVKGDRHTPYDHEQKACSVCSCLTQANVWVRLDISLSGMDELMKKQFRHVNGCWKTD